MIKKKVLIVGVPGVGKSTLCKTILEHLSGVLHLTASDYVKEKGEVDNDQQSLVRSIKSVADKFKGKLILIDGHLTFGNFLIPLETLKLLELDSIIVLKEEPNTILNRRKLDLKRARKDEPVEKIRTAQEKELSYSKLVSERLGVPVYTLKSPTVEKVLLLLEK